MLQIAKTGLNKRWFNEYWSLYNFLRLPSIELEMPFSIALICMSFVEEAN